MNNLKETVELMNSNDYKDRFLAEYFQLKIRYDKLKNMVDNWQVLPFVPTCPINTYIRQLAHMKSYLEVLEERAKMEKIELR